MAISPIQWLKTHRRGRLFAALTAICVLIIGLAGGIITAARIHAASYCSVTYAVTNQWTGGFTVQGITIQNTSGSAWSSWTLTFSFPDAGQAISNGGWNGTFSQSGQNVTVTNLSYNGNVAANASVNPSPGFNGTDTGNNPVPTSFSVNGNVCGGSVTPTNTPSSGGPTNTPTTGNPTPTPTPGNLLTNGGAESGTTGWSVFGSGTLTAESNVVHSGNTALLLTGRTAAWNGISQDVTSKLTNGATYTTTVWVRSQANSPSAQATLALTANGATSYLHLAGPTTVNTSGWTLVSGTATVSWSGSLTSAVWYTETTSGTDSFYLDDASFSSSGSPPPPTPTPITTPTSGGQGPCDIYAAGGTPCVAAHSTVRALYGNYNGNLYQVQRSSDNATMNIGVLSPGGFANAAAQDSFCANTTCVITIIYDQSGRGNNLTRAPGGGAVHTADNLAVANALPLTVGGHHVYGIHSPPGTGYRDDSTNGIATGDNPEGEYAIMDGTYFNGGCCFDYGNAETNNNDDGNGTMEAISFGNINVWGTGSGRGPWVYADLENGLWTGNVQWNNPGDQSISFHYVTAIVKGTHNLWAIKAGNAQTGNLTTMWNGPRPSVAGYNPMSKQGAIILGIGGDNSNGADGNFYEGAMTSGYPSDATENAVQANIVAAGYGR